MLIITISWVSLYRHYGKNFQCFCKVKCITQGYTFSKGRFGTQAQGCPNTCRSITLCDLPHSEYLLAATSFDVFLICYFKQFLGYGLFLLVLLLSSKYYCFVITNIGGMMSAFWIIKILSFV